MPEIKPTTIRIPEQLDRKLRERAEQENRSPAQVIRRALARYLKLPQSSAEMRPGRPRKNGK